MSPRVQIPLRRAIRGGKFPHMIVLLAFLLAAVCGLSRCSRSKEETSPPSPSTVDRETLQRVYDAQFLRLLANPRASPARELPAGLRKVAVDSYHEGATVKYQVTLDLSHQMLDLSVPKEVGFGEKEGQAEAYLFPSFSGTDLHARDFAPAAALALKAKQFDDGLYACVEMAADAGLGRFPAKRQFLLSLLKVLNEDSGRTAAALLTAAARLGGEQPQVSPNVARQAGEYQREFLAAPLASEVLGFYTWNDDLARIFRRDRILQKQINEQTARAFTAVLSRDDKLLKTYTSHLSLMERLTNPLSWNDLRGPALAMKAGRAPSFTMPISFYPPSRSQESDLFKSLYGDVSPPEGFSLADELVKRLRAGTLDFKPKPDSGWYEYQEYALEPLAVPERTPEGEHLRFNDAYRKLLVGLFKGLAALTRETHVKQREIPERAALAPPPKPQLEISPNLTVEPLASYYLRRADSYRFVREVVLQAFGPKGLTEMRRLTAAGPVNVTLGEELRLMEGLFYGGYRQACLSVGIKAEQYPGSKNPKSGDSSGALLGAWMASLDKDPDLGQDIRMMVPIFFDQGRQKTKVWAVLGIGTTPLTVSYVTPPVVKEIEGPDGKVLKPEQAEVKFVNEEERIAYIASAEVYVTRLLNRAEFRKHCDRYKTYKEIVSHLR